MRRLLPFTGPAAFVFKDPDTGFNFYSRSREELVNRIIHYRAQNELPPIEHLNLVLENYWCSLPQNAGSCEDYKLQRGWMAILKGGIQILENMFFGEKNMVDLETAEARAKICKGCPKNIFLEDKAGFIKWSDEIAEASTGGKTTSNNKYLGNCAVCSCPLRALVWSKYPKIEISKQDEYPDFCWKLHDANTKRV